jgi:hypothetical protein
VREALPELSFVQARLVLGVTGLSPDASRRSVASRRHHAVDSSDSDDRTVTGTRQGYRPAACLDLIGECLYIVVFAERFLLHCTRG